MVLTKKEWASATPVYALYLALKSPLTSFPPTQCRYVNDFEKWSTKSYATYTQFKSLTLRTTRDQSQPITHVHSQRQRYDIIRENCAVTTNLVNNALYLSDEDAVCARAFRGIFLTLKTMLANEVTRAEAINLRAFNYWHHHVIPDPPRHPRSVEQRCESAIARRIGLYVDLSSDTSSDNETNDGSSPRYSPTSPQTPQ